MAEQDAGRYRVRRKMMVIHNAVPGVWWRSCPVTERVADGVRGRRGSVAERLLWTEAVINNPQTKQRASLSRSNQTPLSSLQVIFMMSLCVARAIAQSVFLYRSNATLEDFQKRNLDNHFKVIRTHFFSISLSYDFSSFGYDWNVTSEAPLILWLPQKCNSEQTFCLFLQKD